MSDQIIKLRAIADFAAKHNLAEHLGDVGSLRWAPRVQLYEAEDSAIEALLAWAVALEETVIYVREVEQRFHLSVCGELPGVAKFSVVVVTEEAETQAIVEAGMYRRTDLPVALAVMRTLIRRGDGAQ